ncbi:MAG: HDOD domain-containing protein [Deltaproteobacteria bacterium]|nr:HDOD domain-containing protein [Candidatus Anaeroferrophillus wilburensis]MBN2888033.1 HDOD domain-containing protein [Deltaproteobacteria bacterium]
MTVFIIDHHAESADYIAQIVSSLGLTPKPIKSIAELVTTLQQGLPRLIITEALLPGYDDFLILQHVKEQENLKDIPVIVTTSRSKREDIIKARQLGAKGFLIKPFDKKALIQQIKLALNIRDLTGSSTQPTQVRRPPATGRHQSHKISLSTINNERLKSQILQKIESIPSLPAIVYKVMQLIQDEKSCAADFQDLIAKDQAMTARMLRMVNSSFFSLSRKINSISDAVVYLGHNTIRSLVLGASTSNIFKKSLTIYGYPKEGLWLHSNIVAAIARHLAKEARLTPAEIENCYISGLLHDIGKLILGPFVEQFADRFTPILAAGKPISGAEKDILGFDHGEIGGILLTNWKLPKNLVETVSSHHSPDNATVNPREAIVVSLADNLCNRQGFALAQPLERLTEEERHRGYKALNLPPDWEEQHQEQITDLAGQVEEMISKL